MFEPNQLNRTSRQLNYLHLGDVTIQYITLYTIVRRILRGRSGVLLQQHADNFFSIGLHIDIKVAVVEVRVQ